MPITKDPNVQEICVKYVDVNFGDYVTGTTDYPAIDIPPNSVVLGGSVFATVSTNTGTSAAVAIGDATLNNRYVAAADVKTVNANTALVPTGFVHPGGPITLRFTGVGAVATTGKFRVLVQYVTLGKSESSYEY